MVSQRGRRPGRPLTPDKPVVLVAFEEQDNLGVGYIASALLDAGFEIRIIDFRVGEEAILANLLRLDPVAVGFSIIFQHHIARFKDLLSYLRDKGISCHFCAGGHYPSLRHRELLDYLPELDSVVLFEGEITFLKLVQALAAGQNWKRIAGIAYRENGSHKVRPLRPLVRDLDDFSPPVRLPLREYVFGKKYATLLAGRGCVNHCSFCSIREFYSAPPGPVKRLRRPEMVVREMELLHREKDCSIFMFQDDDFPVTYQKKEWVREFCRLLEDHGLHRKILWKINCRPDEVDRETFSLLRDHGLFLVYLGIESGTDEGLRLMKKRITVDTNLKAASTLKELGILFDYGFMLFDPSSTFQTVRDNLAFLKKLSGDGASPITFCKMLPYAETQVEKVLKAEGRLKGEAGNQDYDFLDKRLNSLYGLMAESFGDWIGDHDGLLNLARWARYFLTLYRKYFPAHSRFLALERETREIIARSNLYFVDTAGKMTSIFASDRPSFDIPAARALQKDVAKKHKQFSAALNRVMNKIEALPHSC
jgi:anaerobic magnesium-protoporphyrin IX monomethyl ester cyclase